MSGFVEGIDRSQSTLFPATLDDYVAEDNLVRAVDAIVEGLDLGKLGFGRVAPLEKDAMGRAARIMAPSSLQRMNGAPHARAERFEQIPRNSRTRCNTNRRDRDGPVELAGRRYRAWRRALAVEEARGR